MARKSEEKAQQILEKINQKQEGCETRKLDELQEKKRLQRSESIKDIFTKRRERKLLDSELKSNADLNQFEREREKVRFME